MKTMTIDNLAELSADELVLVDVREPDEYHQAHVPGAMLIRLAEIPSRHHEIPKDRPVQVICRSGNRSKVGVSLLEAYGFDAVNVLGGTDAWISSGRPVVTGANPR